MKILEVAESVGIGHPDKIADFIADKLLEDLLNLDNKAQLAAEVLASKNLIVVAGEWNSSKVKDLPVSETVKEVLEELEYEPSAFKIINNLQKQSEDIRAYSLESPKGVVSGDQSVVVGFACSDTSQFLPSAYSIAQEITQTLEACKKSRVIDEIGFDSKCLVVLSKTQEHEIFISVQHLPGIDLEELKNSIFSIVTSAIAEKHGIYITKNHLHVNESGPFIFGGLNADTGITNRKLMVDSYGLAARHGGGGYSGKDLTKVDRLGAYYARWICKNLVAAKACELIELELVYVCASEKPSFKITNLKSNFSQLTLMRCIEKVFTFTFSQIYDLFNKPGLEFSRLARKGHYCTNTVPWEELNKVEEIKKILFFDLETFNKTLENFNNEEGQELVVFLRQCRTKKEIIKQTIKISKKENWRELSHAFRQFTKVYKVLYSFNNSKPELTVWIY